MTIKLQRTLIFISVFVVLGCTPEERRQKANSLVTQSIADLASGDADKSMRELREAQNELLGIDDRAGVCEQAFWDTVNVKNRAAVQNLRLETLNATNTPEPSGAIFSAFVASARDYKLFDVSFCRGQTIIRRLAYDETFNEFEAARRDAQQEYTKITGDRDSLLERAAGVMESENRFSRRNRWDLLSPEEKSKAARDDASVSRCLDAALTNNRDAEGISNIVSDAATICRQGLGK